MAILPASVALADNLTTLGVINGKCTLAEAEDVIFKPGLCTDKVMNIELPNGRLGFSFIINLEGKGRALIMFFGDGSKQLHINADTAMQPIDRVDFTFQDSTDHLVAAGSCRFSNPYKGEPAQVSCSADTNQGKFVGEFLSDGHPPDITQTRGVPK